MIKCLGLQKNLKEISNVLKVSEETIWKRVNEFKNLKVASLTQEEFLKLPQLDIEIEAEDPPSFKKNKLKSLENAEEVRQIKGQIEEVDEKLNKLIQKKDEMNDIWVLEQRGEEIVMKTQIPSAPEVQ